VPPRLRPPPQAPHAQENPCEKPTAKKPSGTINQFKITLLGTKPKIWRRIQIPDCKLNTLHCHIQAVMGWSNSHLHHFEIKDERYGIPEHLDYDGDGSTRRVTWLMGLLPRASNS
jgi:hypothetical protein